MVNGSRAWSDIPLSGSWINRYHPDICCSYFSRNVTATDFMCGNGTRWSISKTIWTRPDNDRSSMLTSTSAPTLNNKRIYIIWLIARDLLIKAITDVPFAKGVGPNLRLKLWIELNVEIHIGYRSSPFLLTEENRKRFLNFRDNLDENALWQLRQRLVWYRKSNVSQTK